MKKIVKIICILFLVGTVDYPKAQCSEELLNVCYPNIGNYKFLKSYPVRMKKSKKGEPPTVIRNSVVFNSGETYRVVGCNASEYDGKVVVTMYSGSAMVSSNMDQASGKLYPGFDFQCKKSGVYYLCFYFEGGKEGCSMILVSQKG